MPIALAILITFVVTPPVTWLQRWIGRIPAVLAMVTLVFTFLGLAGWGLAQQMDQLAKDPPRSRNDILTKVADVRHAGEGGSVEKLQETIQDIQTDLGKSETLKGTVSRPVVVTSEQVAEAQPLVVVCIANLPPSAASKTRYLVKRLRAALPEAHILVGRWAPPALADESTQALRAAGANLVASTLLETRTYLAGLKEAPAGPVIA